MTDGTAKQARSLDELRAEVETADALPVGRRLAAFDRVNGVLVDELSQLDEL